MDHAGKISPEHPPWYTHEITQPPPQVDRLSELLNEKTQDNSALHRLERWKLQSVSRELLPAERVGGCMRRRISGEVQVKALGEKAHYRGLMTCGSVWLCPVCAAKISERRCIELSETIAAATARGFYVLLVTQTVPHYSRQALETVLEGLQRARRLMRNRKPWKKLTEELGLVGTVRGLEVTWGEVNGWHPHIHELWIVRANVLQSLAGLRDRLFPMWESACLSAGLNRPNKVHGITVEGGKEAARYVADWGREKGGKGSIWGLEHELAKSHVKKGREGRLSPWDLLRAVYAGDVKRGVQFEEYARCFRGKHQLEYSRGLRAVLDLGEVATDEEIAKADEPGAELLGTLKPAEWRIILRADRRGELLEVAGREGWAGVVQFIRGLCRADCPF